MSGKGKETSMHKTTHDKTNKVNFGFPPQWLSVAATVTWAVTWAV